VVVSGDEGTSHFAAPDASAVAESAYRHVIENAISGVENLPIRDAIEYLRNDWLPFALDCQKAWQEADRARS
jgi:hypothetical protein